MLIDVPKNPLLEAKKKHLLIITLLTTMSLNQLILLSKTYASFLLWTFHSQTIFHLFIKKRWPC